MNSINAKGQRPPSWRDFLESGIERCQSNKSEMSKILRSGDYLTCCQIIKYKLAHDWVPFVEEKFLQPMFKHNKTHELIFKLDSPIVLTPNFDKIYDNYAVSQTSNLIKIKKYHDDDLARSLRGGEKQRLILKIHGCIDTPDRLVFTREDYADIRNKFANFYRAMDALVLTHTFLFIGCGMNDPDLSLILEQYARSFGSAPPHYITFSGKVTEEYKNMIEKNYNLRLLKYSSNDDHKELQDSLESLVKAVNSKRDDLSTSQLW
ncbi:SIR2 family NAD-dependent protein deacylase [Niveispirillum irakense]|uniref:SIR2 family NAD-dependent protein deacylase n=1 Tax=Niveispirillum irakense TaxID=34011 RepID=UPI000A0165A5|nr:SIR2 family protein [Niveispirillum irakense]